MPETVVGITHLRDCLGVAYQHVVNTDEPIVVQRYKRQDVMLVPAWEWRFLKQVEADIRAGRCPWEDEADDPGLLPVEVPASVDMNGTDDHQDPPGPAHEESGETDAALA